MDFLGPILILLLLAIIILPIAAIVVTRTNARDLREEIAGLNDRLRDLESQLQRLVAERSKPAEPPAGQPDQISGHVEVVSVPSAPAEQMPAQQILAEPAPALKQDEQRESAAAAYTQPPQIAAFRSPAEAAAPIPPATSAPPAPSPPAQAPAPQVETPRPTPSAEIPSRFATPEAPATKTLADRSFSMEERLGANWLNKLGIVILVVGLAFFLAYKLETMGPAGKVLCGFAVSAALLGGGVWLERKATYRVFARACIGGGWALGFFTTFAMHHVPAARVLPSLTEDLVLMLIVAAGMVAHSLRYRSQTVTGLAFLLGFTTLLTSHIEAASGTVVFSLTASALLALGLVVVTTLRHWAGLELAGVVAVYLTHLVWLSQVLPQNHAEFAQFWPSTALILLYWLIFRLAYVLRTPLNQGEENLSSLSAVLNSGGVLGLLKFQAAHPEWAFWALAALGAIEMALAFTVRARRRQAFVVLSTIATVLLVAAVPFKFHGVSWPVLWLVEAQVLAVCGLRLGEPVFRRLGLLAGVVTGGVLAFHDVFPLLLFRLDFPDPARHTSLIVALALAAVLYWVHAEVYPRRWPQIAEHDVEAFALRITSWLGAAAATAALWVALPDLWLPIGWLALVLLLAFAAHWFHATLLAIEADMLALASATVLVFDHVRPLALFRLSSPDPSHHPAETAVLALAAAAFWTRAEIYPRVLPGIDSGPSSNFDIGGWQSAVLPLTSWLGVAAAASALWIALPAPWVVVGWLALVVLLGLAADWAKTVSLALQADALAVTALFGMFPCNVFRAGTGSWDYDAPLFAAVALLYLGMRRKTVPEGVRGYVAPAYSWAATLLLAFAASDISPVAALTPLWALLGVALFEVGRSSRKGFLRWQGFFLVALAFARYLAVNLPDTFGYSQHMHRPALIVGGVSLSNSLLLEVLILAAAGYWLLERTRNDERCTQREHIASLAANALGNLSIALWFAYRFPSKWVPAPGGEAWVTAIWAGMATILLALAWLVGRRAFLVQALALAVAVLGRAFFLDLPAEAPPGFWQEPLFHCGVAVLILLAALPFAFRLRGQEFRAGSTLKLPPDLELILRYPEQWFFFAAFALQVVALAVKLSSGHITIAWSLLALGVFLFALAVGERSYRLAGLALLLVSVVKILLMDVWALSPSDRYTTLIVLGLALLAVSFLYTRFSAVIRRYL